MPGGAVTQVMNTGVEDAPLNGSPDVTFFDIEIRQYTNFAIESIENIFNGQTDFGRKCTAVLARAGDLVGPTFLQITLPQIDQSMGLNNMLWARWLDCPGEQIIAEYEIEVGNQRVDKKFGDFIHIWNNLTLPANKIKGYYYLIGHTPQLTYLIDPNFAPINQPCNAVLTPGQVCAPRNTLPETTLYIPLMFWYTSNPGLALPLIALQFHEVRINVTLRPIGEVLWAVHTLAPPDHQQAMARQAMSQTIVSCSLFADYYFLEADERRKIVHNSHDFLFTQLQFTGELAVGSAIVRSPINWSHPNSEMIFVVQPDYNVDYCGSFQGGHPLFNVLGVQTFNYTDAIDSLPNAMMAYGSMASLTDVAGSQSNFGFITTAGVFQQPGGINVQGSGYVASYGGGQASNAGNSQTIFGPFATNNETSANGAAQYHGVSGNTGVNGTAMSDAAVFVVSEMGFDLHCWGENPVVTCKLQLNSQDRFTEREGSYFDGVQIYQFHSRTADRGINVYSFAFNPEGYQPSGACNFSRMDNVTLHLVLSSASITGVNTAKLRIYGIAYNHLKIQGGMLGISFA